MNTDLTSRFQAALAALERERDHEPLVNLFHENASIANSAAQHEFTGSDGARRFWTTYRSTFEEMESRFRAVIVSGNQAALEWTTEGLSLDGAPLSYEGVSVLDYEGDRIVRFRAYFDPAKLGAQLQHR